MNPTRLLRATALALVLLLPAANAQAESLLSAFKFAYLNNPNIMSALLSREGRRRGCGAAQGRQAPLAQRQRRLLGQFRCRRTATARSATASRSGSTSGRTSSTTTAPTPPSRSPARSSKCRCMRCATPSRTCCSRWPTPMSASSATPSSSSSARRTSRSSTRR